MRVAGLRGNGTRAFASGMDLKQLQLMQPAKTQEHFDQLNRVLRRIETAPFSVVAMVYGFAIGGGCELAAACASQRRARESASRSDVSGIARIAKISSVSSG